MLIGLGSCVLVGFLLLLIPQCGCIGVDPSARMRDVSVIPKLTAREIETAVQLAINSNSSVVNDLWPFVAVILIGVGGTVWAKKIANKTLELQTQDLKDHVDKCNGHS